MWAGCGGIGRGVGARRLRAILHRTTQLGRCNATDRSSGALLCRSVRVCRFGVPGIGCCGRQRARCDPRPRACAVRRRRRPQGLFLRQQPGHLVRHQRRLLPRPGGRRARQPRGRAVPPAVRRRALRRAAVGRGRRGVAQRRHDLEPRHHAGHPLPRRAGLRRTGLPGAQGAERRQRAGTVRRAHLRHHGDRRCAGRGRFLQRPQAAVRPAEVRQVGRCQDGLCQQELPGALGQPFGARRRPPAPARRGRAHHPAGAGLQAARSARPCARATTTGSAWCAGPSMR